MTLRRTTVLSSAIAMALYANPQPLLAQDADQDDMDNLTEEVVVVGIRRSIEDSVSAKRYSDQIIDVISAEDVGKFPDKNVAESLSRVPGVVINREFGEGERVSIRGTAPNLTRTLLNGHALATADWFILDQLNSTRSFNYLMLPSDIIGKVEVIKSSQANIEEGGIGGTVNVHTRNPFDLDANRLYVRGEMLYNDLADETDPNFSGLYSWKNTDETFGVLVAAVRQERTIRRDGVEVLGYQPVEVDGQTAQFPTLIGSALFQQERIRTGGNFGVQWRPSDRLEFNLTGLYSEFEGDNSNYNFLTWGNRALGNGGTLTDATVIDGTVVAGRVASLNDGTSDFGAVYDAILREATATTNNLDLLTNFDISDAWSGKFRIGVTEAEGNTDNQPFVEFGAPASYTFDLRGSAPQVNFENIDPNNPEDMQFIFSSLHEILNDDEETYAYLDFNYALDGSFFSSIDFGVKGTRHERALQFNATTYGGFHVPINTTPASFFADGTTPPDFLSGVSAPGTLNSYWVINNGRTADFLFDNLANTERVPYPQQSFSVDEDTNGAYVMANFDSGPWRGNFGLRYVKTDQTSRGAVTSPTGSVSNPFGNFDPVVVDRDYDDWLPSLNVTYEFNDNLQGRFAAASVMTRPDFTDIVPRASLNPGALTGTSGNPNLDPYRADQAEIALEWYADNLTAISGAVFYKDIESFITDEPTMQDLQIVADSPPNMACTADPGGENLWTCPFIINQRVNGGGGRSYGFEIAGVKSWESGWGIQGNYTYVDAEADTGDPLPGASEHQYNLTGFFENEHISARLAYTYRSEFFVTFDRSTQLFQDGLESLDASFAWYINDNWALTADAVNLTDEKIEQFADSTLQPRAIYENGITYWVGFRFNY